MVNELILYTYPDSFLSAKALIAAKYAGKSIKIAPGFKMGTTNKSPDYLAKFPTGKVPALEGPGNVRIFESNAIAYYVANEDLKGLGDAARAQVLQWVSFSEGQITPAAVALLHSSDQSQKQQFDRSMNNLKTSLGLLNEFLLLRTYLVGERVTLADIIVCCNLLPLYKGYLDPNMRAAYPNLNRWFTTLINHNEFSTVLGKVSMCSEPFKAKGQEQGKKQAGDSGKKKEQSKPKPVEPEDIEMEDEPVAKPPKDPFEAYPKGNFNFDDFKRFYSNNPAEKAVPYFWEKFDKENFSIWYCDYKFPQELTLTFMSANLIGGMMQRLDRMRKNAFGSMCLFGTNNNSTISGIWVWRGHDLAFTLSDDWQVDYESYDWKKLDPESPETKKLVDVYFKQEGDFGGKVFNQGKIFK